MKQGGKTFYKNPNVQIIFSVTFLSMMGVNLIAPTLPSTAKALNIPHGNIGLIITAFTAPGILLAFIFGIIADKFGRKAVLLPSLLLFGFSGALCFFANSMEILVTLRIIQGIGASGLIMLSTVLIGDIFHGLERSKVMGYNASVISISSSLAPLIGGSLAIISWNYPYLIFSLAVPVSVAVLFMRCPSVKNDLHIKIYLSDTLFIARQPKAFLLFTAATIAFILLYGGILTYFGLLLSEIYRASPTTIGLYFSFMSFIAALASSQAGKIQMRFTRAKVVLIGFMLYGLALFLIPFLNSLSLLILPPAVFGLGHGISMPALQTAVTELAPSHYRGALVSVFGMAMKAGQALGPPALGVIIYLSDFSFTFWSASILTVASSITGYLYVRSPKV